MKHLNLLLIDHRWVSTIQGRPIGFDDSGLDLSFNSLEEGLATEGLENCNEVLLPYPIRRFHWSIIISLIKKQFYRFQNEQETTIDIKGLQTQIDAQLEAWFAQTLKIIETLPRSYRLRLNLKTRIDHHTARCLLYQPSQVCIRPAVEDIRICFQSAVQRLRLFGALYDKGYLPMAWPTMHGLFMAGATMLYSIWYSSDIRSSIAMATLAKDLRLCSSLLTAAGEWWPLVRRLKSSFERLADHTLRSITGQDHTDNLRQDPAESSSINPDALGTTEPQPAEIEQMLQSVLQYNMQVPDVIDVFEKTLFTDSSMTWNPSDFLVESEYDPSMDYLFAPTLLDGPAETHGSTQ